MTAPAFLAIDKDFVVPVNHAAANFEDGESVSCCFKTRDVNVDGIYYCSHLLANETLNSLSASSIQRRNFCTSHWS